MPLPQELLNFDLENTDITVWLFKKAGGAQGTTPTFTGRWITTTDALEAALKESVAAERDRIEEVIPFSLLAQNNEASALSLGSIETHAPIIAEKTETPIDSKRVKSVKHIQNTAFYVIRFVSNNQSLLAIRKTDNSWRSKKRQNVIDVIFDNEALTLDEKPAFSLSRYIDFFVFDDQVFVMNKRNFEAVLHYRAAHEEDFVALRAQQEFETLFTDMTEIIAYVGTNKIHLRRASAIRQKAHFMDPAFMDRLRANFANVGLNIDFDEDGRIIPSAQTCPDIFQALLDHRLTSSFSETNYDVQDATPVG